MDKHALDRKPPLLHYGVVCILLFLLDMSTKRWALSHCATTYTSVFPGLGCELIMNRGIVGGMFHSSSSSTFLSVALVVGCVITWLAVYAYKQWQARERIWGEMLILTGALGNLIDRFLYGGVVDFIVVGGDSLLGPTFNCADVAIVCGIGVLMWSCVSQS